MVFDSIQITLDRFCRTDSNVLIEDERVAWHNLRLYFLGDFQRSLCFASSRISSQDDRSCIRSEFDEMEFGRELALAFACRPPGQEEQIFHIP
jgi:hypothetical protein